MPSHVGYCLLHAFDCFCVGDRRKEAEDGVELGIELEFAHVAVVEGYFGESFFGNYEHFGVEVDACGFELFAQVFEVFSGSAGDIEEGSGVCDSCSDEVGDEFAFGFVVFIRVDGVVLFGGLGEHGERVVQFIGYLLTSLCHVSLASCALGVVNYFSYDLIDLVGRAWGSCASCARSRAILRR